MKINLHKLFEALFAIAMVFLMMDSLVLFYWYFIDGELVNKPIVYEENFLQPSKKEYTAGETFTVYWKFCKYTDQKATITANLVDGYTYYFPLISGSRPKGCYDSVDAVGLIPLDVPSGNYHAEFSVSYRVNPKKIKTYHITTKEFIITGSHIDEGEDILDKIN